METQALLWNDLQIQCKNAVGKGRSGKCLGKRQVKDQESSMADVISFMAVCGERRIKDGCRTR